MSTSPSGLSNTRIRASVTDDVADITDIYGHHVRTGAASFELDAPSEQVMMQRRADVLKQDLPYLVAERDGRIVGYAYASPYRPRPAYRYTLEHSIYVHHEYTGRGIGRSLLDTLIDACEQRGARQLIAVIGDSSNVASIALHTACGFVHSGTLYGVGFKFGRWVDSVLMQRALGAGMQGESLAPQEPS
jgi:L-amino acid N-acyltransferase YncA